MAGGLFHRGARTLSCGTQAPVCAGSVVLAHGLSCSLGMQDPSSPGRDQTRGLCITRWILNHWTTRELQEAFLFLEVFPEPCKKLGVLTQVT